MVNNSAIVHIIDKITSINGAPCKKTLQKIVFLVEQKQIDLGCDYGIHFYGPYSADLDYAVRELSDEGVLKIDYSPMEHKISVVDHTFEGEFSNTKVDEIVAAFASETPSELELIATALYAYLQLRDVNKIKDGVIKLKGTKYSPLRINSAIQKLEMNGYITAA